MYLNRELSPLRDKLQQRSLTVVNMYMSSHKRTIDHRCEESRGGQVFELDFSLLAHGSVLWPVACLACVAAITTR